MTKLLETLKSLCDKYDRDLKDIPTKVLRAELEGVKGTPIPAATVRELKAWEKNVYIKAMHGVGDEAKEELLMELKKHNAILSRAKETSEEESFVKISRIGGSGGEPESIYFKDDKGNKYLADKLYVKVRNPTPYKSTSEDEAGREEKSPYGYCPTCRAKGKAMERCPDGNTICENGHKHPHREFHKEPAHEAGKAKTQEVVWDYQENKNADGEGSDCKSCLRMTKCKCAWNYTPRTCLNFMAKSIKSTPEVENSAPAQDGLREAVNQWGIDEELDPSMWGSLQKVLSRYSHKEPALEAVKNIVQSYYPGCEKHTESNSRVIHKEPAHEAQRQDSVYEQLKTVKELARKAGCYDAEDWIAARQNAAISKPAHEAGKGTPCGRPHCLGDFAPAQDGLREAKEDSSDCLGVFNCPFMEKNDLRKCPLYKDCRGFIAPHKEPAHEAVNDCKDCGLSGNCIDENDGTVDQSKCSALGPKQNEAGKCEHFELVKNKKSPTGVSRKCNTTGWCPKNHDENCNIIPAPPLP